MTGAVAGMQVVACHLVGILQGIGLDMQGGVRVLVGFCSGMWEWEGHCAVDHIWNLATKQVQIKQ